MKQRLLPIVILAIISMSTIGTEIVANQAESVDILNASEHTVGSISVTVPIDPVEIKNMMGETAVYIERFGRLSGLGEPCLPSRIFSIAIPPGSEFVALSYTTGPGKTLARSLVISPISPPLTCDGIDSTVAERDARVFEDTFGNIYGTDVPYPPAMVSFVRRAEFRDYNLVDVRVTPFQYKPQSGLLIFYPNITLTLRYAFVRETFDQIAIDSATIEDLAKQIVLNYNQTRAWYHPVQAANDHYDLVVITLDALVSTITPLVNWETEKGKTVKVVTLSWIDAHYEGDDVAAKMRNFLREKYPITAWGIEDVLIVGHRDDIPMRRTWQQIDPQVPMPETDYYYAELSLPDNESWDADGDYRYGENSDPIDFYGEVNVGRIPWSDPETVSHICEKTVAFEQNNNPAFKNNILLLAAYVDDQTDGAAFTEYIVDAAIHPWMSTWEKTRLYDRNSVYPKDAILNHRNVVSIWSQGTYGVVVWHAHGNPYGSGSFISVDDCSQLNDAYPAIIAAASCSNADTEYLNIGQAMMAQGAVGFLGANKVAFYRSAWDDPTDGSDQSFKYFFTAGVTSRNYTQGQAHQYALREMYTRGLWDRLRYETFIHGSLWGNPSLGLAAVTNNTPPDTPTRPQGPTSGQPRLTYNFTSSAMDPDGDQLYYLFEWGDETDSGWLGPYHSGEQCIATHEWRIRGAYQVTVKAKDPRGAESAWSQPLPVSMPLTHQTLLEKIMTWFACLVERIMPPCYTGFIGQPIVM